MCPEERKSETMDEIVKEVFCVIPKIKNFSCDY